MGARPPSRAFWKRLEGRWSQERGGAMGGAKGGAPLHKGRTRVGRALLLPVGSLSLFSRPGPGFASLLPRWLFLFLFARLLWQFWRLSLSSFVVLRSRFGGRPVQGGTDGGRGSAGGVVDLRVWARSAGVGSQTARGVGARRDDADSRGREDLTVPKGSHYFLFGFLYGCCGAVSCKVELCK